MKIINKYSIYNSYGWKIPCIFTCVNPRENDTRSLFMKKLANSGILLLILLIVSLTHRWISFDSDSADAAIPATRFGIHLFFIIGGYFIMSFLLIPGEKGGPQTRAIGEFYKKTLKYLLPSYYLALLLLLTIGYSFIEDNFSYFMFLTVELIPLSAKAWDELSNAIALPLFVQLTILYPLLVFLIRYQRLPYFFMATILLGIAAEIYLRRAEGEISGFLFMLSGVQAFGITGFYVWLIRTGRKRLIVKLFSVLLPVSLSLHFYRMLFPQAVYFDYLGLTADCIIATWIIHKAISFSVQSAHSRSF